MKKLLLTILLLAPLCGCWQQQDQKVARINTMLSSDIRVRGRLASQACINYWEGLRATRHQSINAAYDKSLKLLYDTKQLTPPEAKKAEAKFSSYHYQLNALVDKSKELELKELEWFDNAANVVDATQEYNQTKDRALLEGAIAGVEALAKTFIANRAEPTNPEEASAQSQMDQMSQEVLGLLKARLGYTGGVQ